MVVLAAIAGAHGLNGEVRLRLFTDDLARYRDVRVGDRLLTIQAVRGAIARFTEVTDRAAAEALRGRELVVRRSALPPLEPGEYYPVDLLDLPCRDRAGGLLGRVALVENFGAGDVLEIERPDGRRFMVPMRAEAVPEWSADGLIVDAAFAS